MNEYDFEVLETLFRDCWESELDPEEAVFAFRQHLLAEHGEIPVESSHDFYEC